MRYLCIVSPTPTKFLRHYYMWPTVRMHILAHFLSMAPLISALPCPPPPPPPPPPPLPPHLRHSPVIENKDLTWPNTLLNCCYAMVFFSWYLNESTCCSYVSKTVNSRFPQQELVDNCSIFLPQTSVDVFVRAFLGHK